MDTWNHACKIALVTNNERALNSLILELPQEGTLQVLQERKYLLKEVAAFFSQLKANTHHEMQRILKQQAFVHQQRIESHHHVDISL